MVLDTFDGETFNITPLANYKILGLVVSVKYYGFDDYKASPLDVCMMWGDLVNETYADYMHFSHGYRRCKLRYSGETPFSRSYITSHVSNNHLIPANNNVLTGLKTIQINDPVYLEGYLVNVESDAWKPWTSSLTRDDVKCEIFYMKKVELYDQIYE